MNKTVYIYDNDGKFVSEYDAQADPLDKGKYIVPVNSTDIAPPEFTEKQYVQFKDGAWSVIDLPSDPVEPEPTFDDLKEIQTNSISAACLSAISAGFTYDSHTYDSDLISRTNIIGTANAVQSGVIKSTDITNWRTSDNQIVQLSSAQLIELGAALLLHINTQYAKSWQLKGLIATYTEDTEANRAAIGEIKW